MANPAFEGDFHERDHFRNPVRDANDTNFEPLEPLPGAAVVQVVFADSAYPALAQGASEMLFEIFDRPFLTVGSLRLYQANVANEAVHPLLLEINEILARHCKGTAFAARAPLAEQLPRHALTIVSAREGALEVPFGTDRAEGPWPALDAPAIIPRISAADLRLTRPLMGGPPAATGTPQEPLRFVPTLLLWPTSVAAAADLVLACAKVRLAPLLAAPIRAQLAAVRLSNTGPPATFRRACAAFDEWLSALCGHQHRPLAVAADAGRSRIAVLPAELLPSPLIDSILDHAICSAPLQAPRPQPSQDQPRTGGKGGRRAGKGGPQKRRRA